MLQHLGVGLLHGRGEPSDLPFCFGNRSFERVQGRFEQKALFEEMFLALVLFLQDRKLLDHGIMLFAIPVVAVLKGFDRALQNPDIARQLGL